MKQLALEVGLTPEPGFESFVPGSNRDALSHLRQWAESQPRSPVPIYLWGESGVGKTHLLLAARRAMQHGGARVGWLANDGRENPDFDPVWSAVIFDDVDRYGAERQHTAFNWFVNALTPAEGSARAVLAAGTLPPADLSLREDLRTRLGWGHVFHVQGLTDDERRQALQQAAAARGVRLPDDVVHYILTRFTRDLGALVDLLDRLDRYALRQQRTVTIPLFKAMLDEDEPDGA